MQAAESHNGDLFLSILSPTYAFNSSVLSQQHVDLSSTRFKLKWIKDESLRNVIGIRMASLNEKEKKYLKDLCIRCNADQYAKGPSVKDLRTLVKAYGERSMFHILYALLIIYSHRWSFSKKHVVPAVYMIDVAAV